MSSSVFGTEINKAKRFVIAASLVASGTLLTACFSTNDGLDGATSRPNSFPPAQNALDDFTSSSTGDSSSSAELESNQVRVTLEVPEAVAGDDGEETRRNLRIVNPDTLIVYRTDQTLAQLGSLDVRITTDDDNRRIITFKDGLPLGPDVIIEASYGGETLRSLAADSDRDIKINPFSEYLASETLNSYSASDLDRILDCVEDQGGSLCLNKYVWGTLADQVHDFEIDIPSTLDVQQAVDFLSGRGDFAGYVASMADYALLGQESSGKISASSADYNSVLWIAELGQTFRESSLDGSGQWGVRTASEKTVTDNNGTGYFYPGLTLTTFDIFNIFVTSLASDIPYDRETLIHSAANQFFERTQWELNTHSSSPGAATLEDEQRLLAGRALYQSITGRSSSQIIGWTRNPYYLDAFAPGETDTPDRVVSSYFTAGKAIELESQNRQLKRVKTLEDHYLSVFELNLLRTDTEQGFNTDKLEGDYNVVYLAAKMTECSASECSGNDVMVIESGVGNWEVSNENINQTMDTRFLRRDINGQVTRQEPSDNPDLRDASWLVSERPSRVFSVGQGQVLKNLGRLSLDREAPASGPDEQPQVGIGASTPEGTLMAFNIDTSTIGKGILIAGKDTNGTSRPSSGEFRLQGVGMAMAANSNRLAHFNNATLSISSSSSASLALRQLDVIHDVAGESVSEPTSSSSTSPISMGYSGDDSGSVSFSSTDLNLEGFYTDDQDQFYLQVRQTTADDELLGLVLATRVPQ
ncbi:hypothetical protein [Marinobacter sp. CHS3-4]|uniref:hypothetical protein n=1 Tax=Marinobacter sp. CHS3-4 TaxID=3045174 RepID=UPI0024B4DD2A|nr:hypothetical protein [Marinobacter sp. CHS3-4]MDI9244953.1 hypothetical protein [Marinobacter sp. CHS3-4]